MGSGARRDLGAVSESIVQKWAAEAGCVANKAMRDRTGWDFIFEVPPEPPLRATPLDRQRAETQCFIQVKASDNTSGRRSVRLSNWKRLIQTPLPAFFLILEFDGKNDPQRAYLVHVWEGHIRRVTERLRRISVSGQPARLALTDPILYTPPHGGPPAHGVKAELLPQICEVFLRARDARALHSTQEHLAAEADILTRGLAHVGVIALVDEATGYQQFRARRALEEILDKFITKELRKWAKTFPDEFYEEMFRLRGWPYKPWSVSRPSVVGRYTNDLVYERLAPGVLAELRKRNPVAPGGNRLYKHHQWLTDDIGHPKLREHLAAIIALMRASANWDQFMRNVRRALPKYGDTIEMTLDDPTPAELAELRSSRT